MSKKQTKKTILKVVFGISIILFLIIRFLEEDVSLSDITIEYDLFALGMALIVLSFFFSIMKLHVLISKYVKNIFETGGLFFIGWFFSSFLPTNMGGDVYIIFLLRERIKSLSKATALVTIQRIVPVLFILLYAVLYSLLRPALLIRVISFDKTTISGKLIPALLLFILFCSLLFIVFKKNFKNWFDRLRDFIINFFRSLGDISRRSYLKLVVISLIFQISRMTGLYLVLLGFYQVVNILDCFLF